MSEQHDTGGIDWKTNGVKIIPGDQLDTNTPQTPGMNRAAAINFARVGAQKIWAGTVHIHANAKTGAHHHGALESVIYVLRGRACCSCVCAHRARLICVRGCKPLSREPPKHSSPARLCLSRTLASASGRCVERNNTDHPCL